VGKVPGMGDLGDDSKDDVVADFEGILGSYDLINSCSTKCRPQCPTK
jgi:hypothetical protein